MSLRIKNQSRGLCFTVAVLPRSPPVRNGVRLFLRECFFGNRGSKGDAYEPPFLGGVGLGWYVWSSGRTVESTIATGESGVSGSTVVERREKRGMYWWVQCSLLWALCQIAVWPAPKLSEAAKKTPQVWSCPEKLEFTDKVRPTFNV